MIEEQKSTPTTQRLQLKKEASEKVQAEFRRQQGRYVDAQENKVTTTRQKLIDTLLLIAKNLGDEKAERFTFTYRIEEIQT